MDSTLFLSLVGFLWVAAITPGPNNMLLTTSGANLGWRSSWPLMLGIILGMQTLLLLVAFGIGGLLLLYRARQPLSAVYRLEGGHLTLYSPDAHRVGGDTRSASHPLASGVVTAIP